MFTIKLRPSKKLLFQPKRPNRISEETQLSSVFTNQSPHNSHYRKNCRWVDVVEQTDEYQPELADNDNSTEADIGSALNAKPQT